MKLPAAELRGIEPGEIKMKRKSTIFKILKWIALVVLALIATFFLVRAIGKAIYSKTPDGGINESMYIDVNGTKQWINIYGADLDNPVLLYLHGGPGSATSAIDYAFTRKWADVYTVVTWDQCNCGKSYDAEQNDITSSSPSAHNIASCLRASSFST